MLTVKVDSITKSAAGNTLVLTHGGKRLPIPATEADVTGLVPGSTYAITLTVQPPTPAPAPAAKPA